MNQQLEAGLGCWWVCWLVTRVGGFNVGSGGRGGWRHTPFVWSGDGKKQEQGPWLGVLVVSGREQRRVVDVGAVRGVLVLRGGRWVVDNASEVRLLEALRSERGVLARLRGLAAVLDEGLIEIRGLRRLNRRLSAITEAEPEQLWRVSVPGDLMAAVAYVCVCVNDGLLSSWLQYGLSARLDANLVRGLLPGPGWLSWHVTHRCRYQTFERDVFWISELPESFWSRLNTHSNEQLRAVAVASDPKTRPGVLEKLADPHDQSREVLDVVASHPRTPARVLLNVAFRGVGQDRADLRVAQNRNATKKLLRELADCHIAELRYVVAAHPNTPVPVLRRLAGDDSDRVRCAVAGAVAAPAAVLGTLASDSDVWVRTNAASNPSTPSAVLETLLGDRLAAVRAAAAGNENTPLVLVASLVADRTVKVRCAVAARNVDAETHGVLSRDPNWKVRQTVGYNLRTPAPVLERLATDCCGEVRAAVAYNTSATPATLKTLASDAFRWARVHVAVNPATPAGVLVALATDDNPNVRCHVAENPAMPLEQIRRLAVDECWEVRAGTALNPNTPENLLRMLSTDEYLHVRSCVSENDNTPVGVVEALRSDADYHVRAAATAAYKRRLNGD